MKRFQHDMSLNSSYTKCLISVLQVSTVYKIQTRRFIFHLFFVNTVAVHISYVWWQTQSKYHRCLWWYFVHPQPAWIYFLNSWIHFFGVLFVRKLTLQFPEAKGDIFKSDINIICLALVLKKKGWNHYRNCCQLIFGQSTH